MQIDRQALEQSGYTAIVQAADETTRTRAVEIAHGISGVTELYNRPTLKH